MTTDQSTMQAPVKVVYLKGYQAALEEICGKLEAQAFKIQAKIEKLEDEAEGV